MTPTCARTQRACRPITYKAVWEALGYEYVPTQASGALNAPGWAQVGFLGAVVESTQRWWSQTT